MPLRIITRPHQRGQNGQPINGKLAPYVADEVQICGVVEQWDNWNVVKAEEYRQLMPHWGKRMVMCERYASRMSEA